MLHNRNLETDDEPNLMNSQVTTEPRRSVMPRKSARADGSQVENDGHACIQHQALPTKDYTLQLVHKLCENLDREGVLYCHWKSNNALDRSASGDNDLDLLVRRADVRCFTEILYRLGFKEVQDPPHHQIPGIRSFYGCDSDTQKLVHVHAHYLLVLGHDMSKNYRLPIERPYLQSAIQAGIFKVPSPEFEFIVFVLRMLLKHSTWDTILVGEGSLSERELGELAYLQCRATGTGIRRILNQSLPYLDITFFEKCEESLRPGYPIWKRALVGRKLQATLRANARRSAPADVSLKFWRRVTRAIRRRTFGRLPKCRLASGGAMIALVGGDGAGKTTALEQLRAWLSKDFDVTQTHLGKPRWSWNTIAIRSLLKLGQILGLYPPETSLRKTINQESLVSPGYPWLMREVCRARDRYLTYVRARRFAATGGLVFLDRCPLSQIQLMDGPQAQRFLTELTDTPMAKRFLCPRRSSRLAKALVKLEEKYYHRIALPELLFVLRVDPEVAVGRKTEEDASFVRHRSTEIWQQDWNGTHAMVIDASKPPADVLSDMKALVWSNL